MLSTKHSSDMKTSGESITTNLDQDVLLSVARYGRAKPSYTTDDLIENYQCGNLNSVVFNQDTAQVPLLGSRWAEHSKTDRLNIAMQEQAEHG